MPMPATRSTRLFAAAGLVLFLLAGGAGQAAAAEVTVKATSPPYGRVDVVPDAVSITFTGDIRDDGAVTVAGPGGVALGARTEVVDDTLREYLDPGPAGDYTITWTATGKDGGKELSGAFSFSADQAHADYIPNAGPPPSPEPAALPARPPTHGDGHTFEVPRLVVPVGLAALLVAASGLIAATNRRRPPTSA